MHFYEKGVIGNLVHFFLVHNKYFLVFWGHFEFIHKFCGIKLSVLEGPCKVNFAESSSGKTF